MTATCNMLIIVLSVLLLQISHSYISRVQINNKYSFEVFSLVRIQEIDRNNRDNNQIEYVPNISKTLKLPVWPVVGGVITQIADFFPNKQIVESLWSSIGGRVVPMPLSEDRLSPFLLLAHHTHSFTPFDPFRYLTKILLPEGFPAHPHAGFDTVTYCIDGGFLHRDSEQCKMKYGDGDVQWMRAGRGIIHEEMWDLDDYQYQHKKIEIFQLWINLPETAKSEYPQAKILSRNDMPWISFGESNNQIKVISGNVIAQSGNNDQHIQGVGNSIAATSVHIAHLRIPQAHKKIQIEFDGDDQSVLFYVRRGSLVAHHIDTIDNSTSSTVDIGDYITYSDAHRDSMKGKGMLTIESGDRGLDCLMLIGDKIQESVVSKGPFVQSTVNKWREKASIFSDPTVDYYWKHQATDEEWVNHCKNLQLQQRIP